MTSKLNMAKIAKKLKRTKQACSMRRYTLKQANADQYAKVKKQAKEVVIQANDTLAIIKKRRKPTIGSAIDKPVLKVKSFSYEGRQLFNSIITVNKLGWLKVAYY